jgi:tRNA wybutosine-synthesizing protein 3
MNRVTEVKHGYKGPRNAPWAKIKETLLAGLENARKEGVVDAEVEPYLAVINAHPDYVTSSSCYGRIVLIDLPDESKKSSQFIERWHRTVTFDEAWNALQKAEGKLIWFKVDPLIIHISCSGMDAAKKLLEAKARAGMKRGGVFHIAANRVQIELDGTHRMELPVKKAGELLITKEYFRTVVSEANAKFRRNQGTWDRLAAEFRRI